MSDLLYVNHAFHITINFGRPQEFSYTNHRKETSNRRVIPIALRFGHVKGYYETDRWLLHCFDLDKNAYRDFDLEQINVQLII